VVLSGAVLGAAQRLQEKLARVAAALLEVDAADVELRDGQLCVVGAPDRRIGFPQVVASMLRRSHLLPDDVDGGPEASYTYHAPDPQFPDADGRGGTFDLTVGHGAHVVMVEVDRDTGKVEILKHVLADDCGVRLNPAGVEGQAQGGVAQGVGQVLLEEHVYDENGQNLAATFMDYLVPTIMEVPMTERTHTETPSPFSPLGVKGAGEGTCVATPAALMSAINDALAPLGVRCTTVPASPQRLWALLQTAPPLD
jgi:CO/xanthine dehydrogenase Mo-binding subunit